MLFFKSVTFADPQLGELRRSRGEWRGTVRLGDVVVPLVLSGSRSSPDPNALAIARSLPTDLASWRPQIERALFEHYEPSREEQTLQIDAAPNVWPHVTTEFVHVDGKLTVEIGYRVAWDEEHTLAARLRDGTLIDLCGSVLAP